MKIKIKYFADVPQLKKLSIGDWIDLYASEDVVMKNGDYALIKLGIGMELPKGYEAHILPRSSTPKNFGIICANGMGIIDNSYNGNNDEWHFPALAFKDTTIEKGDKIAQFRIVKNQPKFKFKKVAFLQECSRGGIGSTGRK